MNCQNCGAPLRLLENRDCLVCEYCTAYYFPKAVSPDGVILLGDGDSDVACPVCRAPLSTASVEDARLLHCRKCRGLLTRQDAFFYIVKTKRARASGPPDRPRPLNPADLNRKLTCPHCGQFMDTHPYYGPGNFVIDSCPSCAVVWLDHGEIGMATNAPGSDRGRGWDTPSRQWGHRDDDEGNGDEWDD